jgi:GLPGLI family protein
MKNLFVAIMAMAIALPALAQKSFEGTVNYDLSYQDLPAEMAAMEAMLPDEMSIQIKGEKTRLEQSMGMGMSSVTITDMKKGSGVLLMDMMGKKMAVEMSKEELEKMDKKKAADKKPEFKYLDETKEIAGYKCKKAIVSVEGAGELEIYYTEDLPAGASKQYEGLNGFPLEYTVAQGPMKIKMTAKTVKQEKLDKSLFETPSGYDKMSFEEFQKSMGGMMGG